jgi:HKD family nuclease
MISQFDILEDLKETSDEYQHVILGTYSLDPDFFELKILPVFRTKDAETILVLTDKKEYNSRFSNMRSAGKEYYIDYCYASQTFHPKFILLIWSEGIKLILGSANLTKQAWFESGEMIGSVTYLFSKPDKKAQKILSDFREFLLKIANEEYLKSQKHRSKILEVVEKLPKIPESTESEVSIIHNMDKPILKQVHKIINEPIRSIMICAPFFNTEGSVLEFFADNNCEDFALFIQPSRVTEFPKEKIKKLKSQGISFSTNLIKFKDNENRFIHAKILIIKTDSASYCLYGSSNPTFSGMLATPQRGNLELCVLIKNSDPTHYDKIVENDSITIEKIDYEAIPENKSEKLTSNQEIHETLVDSYLDRKSLIIARSNPTKSFRIVLAHSAEENLQIPIESEDVDLSIKLNDEQFRFCSRPTYLYLEYNLEEKVIQTNKRWISTQTLELTPRRMDVEKILKSEGRYGLIAFLNKLEQFTDDPEWFYYLLQQVKFEKLGSLEPVMKKNLTMNYHPKITRFLVLQINFKKTIKLLKKQ